MSFSNETVKQLYTGDGVVVTFAIPFYQIANNPNHIEVYSLDANNVETLLTRGVEYTLSPNDVNPVNVVFGSAPTAAQRILVYRKLPITQETAYSNTGPFQKEDFEKSLDKLAMQLQQLNEKVDRAVLHTRGTGYSGKNLPIATTDNLLVWGSGGELANLPLANISNGTYTGSALRYPAISHASGTLTIPATATYSLIICTGAGAKNVDLPSAALAGAGRVFRVMNDGFLLSTVIRRTGTDTLEGSTSLTPPQARFMYDFVSDGVGSWTVSRIHNLEITNAMLEGNIARSKLAAIGQQISSEISFSSTSASYVDITNATVTITTTGRPVYLGFISPANGTTEGKFNIDNPGGVSGTVVRANFKFVRGVTDISVQHLASRIGPATTSAFNIEVPPGAVSHIDPVAAGTYTYKLQGRVDFGPTGTNFNTLGRMIAYEIA